VLTRLFADVPQLPQAASFANIGSSVPVFRTGDLGELCLGGAVQTLGHTQYYPCCADQLILLGLLHRVAVLC
jgi:hypothetical protein